MRLTTPFRLGPPVSLATLALLVIPAMLSAQAVPKANYLAGKSFQLPAKGQPGSPDAPTAVAVGPDAAVHVADERGLIFVYDSLGIYARSYGQDHLSEPRSVVIDLTGEAYVLDKNRKQVVVFGPGGQLLRRIGRPGRRGGELDDPVDLSLDLNGYVYVLDKGRQGVQIFSRDGVFVRDIYMGQILHEPSALAVGNDGTIYVADKRSPTQIFAYPAFPEVPWIGTVPVGIVGRVPFHGGTFAEPVALAVNDYGNLALLDKKQGRLWSRSLGEDRAGDGSSDVAYGGLGSGRGSFREPRDIALDGPAEVLILDRDLRKVERIRLTDAETGSPQPAFEYPIRVSRGFETLSAPLHAVGYRGDMPLFLLDVEGRALSLLGTRVEMRATVYGDTVPVPVPDVEAFQKHFSQRIGSIGRGILSDGLVIVTDPKHDRFALFNLDSGVPLATVGDNYRDQRRLDDPHGVGMLPDGRIVICDRGNDRVKIFSADLASLVTAVPFPDAYGVAVSPAGDVLVWSEDGRSVGRLKDDASDFEPLPNEIAPRPVASLTFDQVGNLLTLNADDHRVTIIEAGLDRILAQLGDEGGLDDPRRVIVDREGNIYIADEGADRTITYRWDVHHPPLTGLSVQYEPRGATVRWNPGPERFVRNYQIRIADGDQGPYSTLARPPGPPFRISLEEVKGSVPRWVRVAPVFVTGVMGRSTEPLPLLNLSAAAARERGDHEAAFRDARDALSYLDQGGVEADQEARAHLLWIAFSSAYAVKDYAEAVSWGQKLAPIAPSDILIEFLFDMTQAHLQLGQPKAAAQRLQTLVGQGPRPEYFQDPAVIELSFRVYRAMRNAGYDDDALEYLRFYTRAIPAAVRDLKSAYRDSVEVLGTRAKLGVGFEYWENANYAEAIRFFQGLLETADLNIEQEILSRQILAAAYLTFGRKAEAEDIFRRIYALRPDFDLESRSRHVQRLYGLTIYANPQTERFFAGLKPGSS